MKPFLTRIIIRTILKFKKRTPDKDAKYTSFELAKAYGELRFLTKNFIKDVIFICIGVFSAAFGFKGFLLSNHFIDGGATGISLLISAVTGFPLYLLVIFVNIPFIFLAYSTQGTWFTIKTIFAIGALALVLATVNFPNVTDDNILVAVFGGFFLGAGIGFSIRGGAVIDGTEVLAVFLSRKLGITIGDIIIVINIMIFGTAAYFLGVDIALYSMITYLTASKTLDFIVEGIEEYIGVTIVSFKSEEIREMIINKLGRGVTIYNGKRGYGKRDETKNVDIIYTVITRLELNRMKTEVEIIEPTAFIIMNRVKDTKGGVIKKRPLH